MATVKLIWVLQEEINDVRSNAEASIMLDYTAAWFKAGSSELLGWRLSVFISQLRDKHGRCSSQQRLHTVSTLKLKSLPPSYVVQEGELGVHQAGQEGDLSINGEDCKHRRPYWRNKQPAALLPFLSFDTSSSFFLSSLDLVPVKEEGTLNHLTRAGGRIHCCFVQIPEGRDLRSGPPEAEREQKEKKSTSNTIPWTAHPASAPSADGCAWSAPFLTPEPSADSVLVLLL